MRYIPLFEEIPRQSWLDKAAEYQDEIEKAATMDEKQALIDKYSGHWGKLKDWLLELSHGKCWYSEAREIFSHYHVEHFRPKNKAINLDKTEREGYWWLAFDWKNYRISGSVGNCKKGNHFPLASAHAANSNDRNTDDEQPYLLDPADRDDPSLISFNETGEVIPSEEIEDWEKDRVEKTRDILNLDYEPLKEARRKVWAECWRKIGEYQTLVSQPGSQISAARRERIKNIFNRLREMIQPSQELSSVVIECLKYSNLKWTQRIITRS